MREFNKLFVVALPRCATVSMSQALGILGVRTAHLGAIYGEAEFSHLHPARLQRMLQQIEDQDFDLDILRCCDGLADYPACALSVMEQLDRTYPGSLFINIQRRDRLQWLQSVETQFVGLELINNSNSATADQLMTSEVLRRFRAMTFDVDRFDARSFNAAYEKHQRAIHDYFVDTNNFTSLLVIEDASQLARIGFELLCEFLQIDSIPKQSFPHSNAHSLHPREVFLSGLKAGTIQSQTGIIE